ncbi:MAG: ABC transporter permease [Syntrophomonadaceae bacterium]|nr:ABC transporter permease [Syntrophomonadaceae bacterium]
MKLRTIGLFFQQAMASLRRNGWMSIASIITMAICLMVLGTALLVVLNTNKLVSSIESDVEIIAYVDENASAEEKAGLEKRLTTLPGLAEVVFVSKEEALEELKEKFGPENDLVGALKGNNPLPDAYKLKANDPQEVILIAQELEKWPVFEKVRYGQGVVEKLFSVTYWIKLVAVIIMGFLALTAVFVIATTIRSTMNTRRKEIEIMKLVGATDWFIRWPFLIEGLFLGLIGAIVAVGALSGSYLILVNNLKSTLAFIPLISDPKTLLYVFAGLVATGLFLGTTGTILSIYKFSDI